jgi:hypothetical protein
MAARAAVTAATAVNAEQQQAAEPEVQTVVTEAEAGTVQDFTDPDWLEKYMGTAT